MKKPDILVKIENSLYCRLSMAGHNVVHYIRIIGTDIILEESESAVYRWPDFYTYWDTTKYDKYKVGHYEAWVEIKLNDKNRERYAKEYDKVIQRIASNKAKLENLKLPAEERKRIEKILDDAQYRFLALYDILET